jgi:signal transduction histidine kinase
MVANTAWEAFEVSRAPDDAAPGGLPNVFSARALASQEAQRRELFSALRTPIVTTAMSGRVTGFNAAAVALFGSPARLYGRNIREVLPFVPEPSDTVAAADAQGRVADATGRTVDLEVSRTVLMDHEDHGYAVEILDTEYPRLTPAEVEQVLGTARRTARRMRTLMEDLLSAGSIQSGHFVVAPRVTELASIVSDALEIVGPGIDGRGQRVELELPQVGSLVLADKRYARQVLTNLLANASKYSPEQSVIRIVGAPNANMMRISVVDQGPGIAPEQQAGLFERFYRVRSDTDAPGVGLGLAIAKGIVEAHGGRIGIDSEVGIGTSVWFTLPKASRRA